MSRKDQYIGKSFKAVDFIIEHGLKKSDKIVGTFIGMFGDEYILNKYIDENNYYIAEEFLQASPWSSGPMFFIGLRVCDNINGETWEILWEEDEISRFI